MSIENTESKETEKEDGEFVPKKAYQEISQDMHKYKNQLRETEAVLNQLKAEREAADLQALKDSEQWKTLFEKTEAELKAEREATASKNEKFINTNKRLAVIRDLGGFKKDEYNSFINVANVEMDESGNIIPESLTKEVNRLRQAYPELLKGAAPANLPSEAPKDFSVSQKDFSSMTPKERDELKLRLMTERSTKKA